MNVLILGSGGREHVLAWKAAQSHIINKLFVAPGNAGTAQIAQNVDLSVMDFSEIAEFCKKNAMAYTHPGEEGSTPTLLHSSVKQVMSSLLIE